MMRSGTTLVGTAAERAGLAPIRAGQIYAERDTGAIYIADETPAWQYYPSLIPGDLTVGGNITLDDGAGNSPRIFFVGGSDERAMLHFDDTARAFVVTLEDDKAEAMRVVDDGGADEYLTFITTNIQREIVINQSGADIDTRIEAVGQPHAIFVQASSGKVGIWVTPTATLSVYNPVLDSSNGIANFYDDTLGDGDVIFVLIGKSAAGGEAGAFAFREDTTPGDESMGLMLWGDAYGSGLVQRKGGNVGFGTIFPGAKVHADQSSGTGTKPVLWMVQADVDYVLAKVTATSNAGDANYTLVDAGDFGTPGALLGWMQWEIADQRGGGLGNIDVWLPFYATPT